MDPDDRLNAAVRWELERELGQLHLDPARAEELVRQLAATRGTSAWRRWTSWRVRLVVVTAAAAAVALPLLTAAPAAHQPSATALIAPPARGHGCAQARLSVSPQSVTVGIGDESQFRITEENGTCLPVLTATGPSTARTSLRRLPRPSQLGSDSGAYLLTWEGPSKSGAAGVGPELRPGHYVLTISLPGSRAAVEVRITVR